MLFICLLSFAHPLEIHIICSVYEGIMYIFSTVNAIKSLS